MSALKTKLWWYEYPTSLPIQLDDAFDLDPNKGLDISQNTAIINIKHQIINDSQGLRGDFVNTNGELRFKEGQDMKIYAKYCDDSSEINTSPNSPDLLGIFTIVEFKVDAAEKKVNLQLGCSDKTFVILNRLWAKSYRASAGWTSPTIIQNAVQSNADKPSGSGEFVVSALLDTQGGFIQSKRPNGSNFPPIDIGQVYKPVVTWVKDLSQIEYTNSATEQSYGDNAGLVCRRPYVFYVDELNRLHWFYPTDVSNYDYAEGDITNPITVYNYTLTKKVFDVTNMIIFNAGIDPSNPTRGSVYGYKFDEKSEATTLKMGFRAWTDIATQVRKNNPTFTYIQFYDAAKLQGKQRAAKVFEKVGNARWEGKLEIKGKKILPGELIKFTSRRSGLLQVLLRVKDIQHNISKTGWFTTLTVEEDIKELR